MVKIAKIDDATFEAARQRGEQAYAQQAVSARFDAEMQRLVVKLNTERAFAIDPRRFPGLAEATDQDLAAVAVEGVGGTLRFPSLDADFTLSRVIEDFVAPDDWEHQERTKQKAS